ncbi:olfactory receptor 10J4-like [Hyla sarda]|uniref:olfactory receptor 10J4-like n=1 Tax=Hyla sarda TaxID=327740 RepID=UPI0024C268F4|nr:olfactory receptor 10J4-like [Hyla sarda]
MTVPALSGLYSLVSGSNSIRCFSKQKSLLSSKGCVVLTDITAIVDWKALMGLVVVGIVGIMVAVLRENKKEQHDHTSEVLTERSGGDGYIVTYMVLVDSAFLAGGGENNQSGKSSSQKMKRREIPTNGTIFILLGFSDLSLMAQVSLFLFFLFSFFLSLVGNGLIILAVTLSPRLHTPMYFFLKVLSFVEILSITSTVPKALQSFFWGGRTISLLGCAAQFFFFIVAAACECALLTMMAYDRYMAICHPLRYMSFMTVNFCYQATLYLFIFAIVNAVIECFLIFSLPYCDSHLIAHFFCDIPPMMTIACANTFIVEIYQLLISATSTVVPSILIICSYIRILTSIFLLHSAESRQKAFVTCGSHLISVVIFFGTAMFVHLRLDNPFSSYDDRMLALSYCVIIPTINPLIYSLKNKEMKEAIWKLKLI